MSNIVERLTAGLEQSAPVDKELLADAVRELTELREQRDQMEEILILLVRTGLPWGEDGMPNERFESFKLRYANAIHEAAQLLGLEVRSTITRTEPKTM
jgi:hypothetical protein